MAALSKRFYKDVAVAEEPGGFAIRLDGRDVKTPARAPLLVPRRQLAEAIAEEWRAQDAKIQPATMPLTKFAYTAIDRVAPNRDGVIEQILGFGKTDLVCYRAEGPSDLVRRQAAIWDPLLHWARERFGADLAVGEGFAYVEQPESTRLRFEAVVSEGDNFRLAGLHAVVSLLGSLVIALALDESVLDPDSAFAAARLDELYQAEKWGEDTQITARALHQAKALGEAARFLGLLRDG